MTPTQIILINWGILESGNYPLGSFTMLKGETGIGKTTLQDAVQLIMTANLNNVARYNAAQEDASATRTRSARRTPEEYALGAEEGAYARPESSISYVALHFESSEQDAEKSPKRQFTAIAAIQASMNEQSARRRAARLDHLAFALIDAADVPIDTFLSDQRNVVPIERLQNHLKQSFPGHVHYFNADQGGKHEYLTRLHARLCGVESMSQYDALEASKAWAKSIAYRKIENVNDVVRNEVLEEKPIREQLDQVAKALANLSEVTQEAGRLAKNKGFLESVVVQGESVQKNFFNFLALQYADPLGALESILEKERKAKQAFEAGNRRVAELEAEEIKADADEEHRKGELTALAIARSQIPGAAEKDRLKDAADVARKEFAGARQSLVTLLKTHEAIAALAQWVQTHKSTSVPLRKASDAVGRTLQSLRKLPPKTILDQVQEEAFKAKPSAGSIGALKTDVQVLEHAGANLVQALVGAEGFQAVALGLVGEMKNDVARLDREVGEVRRRLTKVEEGGSDYPVHVASMYDMLRRELPQSSPKVLCDLIEPIAGSQWMNAIEGFIGAARFNFVVDRGHELAATERLRVHKARSNVRIIQGQRVLAKGASAEVARDSIINELNVAHPVAEAFLRLNYGRARKLKERSQVSEEVVGTTIEGLACSGNTQYACNLPNEELVFGQEAKRDAAARLRDELREKASQAELLRSEIQWIQAVQGRLANMKTVEGGAAFIDAMLSALAAEASAQERLASLDIRALTEIEARIKAKEAQLNELAKNARGITKALSDEKAKLDNIQRELADLAHKSDETQPRLSQAKKIIAMACEVDASLDTAEIEARAEEEAKRMQSEQGERLLRGSIGNYTQARGRFEGELRSYNEAVIGRQAETVRYVSEVVDSADYAALVTSYAAVLASLNTARAILKRYKEIEIETNQAKLEEARASFNSTFVTSLCLTVKGHVDEGLQHIQRLNERLSRTHFADDWFEVIQEPAKAFWSYYELFNAVSALGEVLEKEDLFATERLDEKHRETLESLSRLLQSKGADEAQRELALISDYRQYRNYDVLRHTRSKRAIPISEWGRRGSGGQLETAGYVLRLTVLTNKLKHFDKRKSHLRFLILDEAFQNMDEERTRAMIRFIRDHLKLQLVLAMPLPKVNQFLDEFDCELAFSKKSADNGEIDYVTEVDVRMLDRKNFAHAWDERRSSVTKAALKVAETSVG